MELGRLVIIIAKDLRLMIFRLLNIYRPLEALFGYLIPKKDSTLIASSEFAVNRILNP